jgi:hypothetical protein
MAEFRGRVRQACARLTRANDVGKQQIHGSPVLYQSKCFPPVFCREHPISKVFDNRRYRYAHDLVVSTSNIVSLPVTARCVTRVVSDHSLAANIDEIVCNHAEPDPALHAFVTFVPAAIEAMSALADADASLASDSPSLTVAEPTLLLLAFALSAFGGPIGDADPLHTPCFRNFLILVGMEAASVATRCGVRPNVAWWRPEPTDRCRWGAGRRLVIDHNLVFSLLKLNHFAELVGLGRLALSNNFCRRLEQAEDFPFGARIAVEDASTGQFVAASEWQAGLVARRVECLRPINLLLHRFAWQLIRIVSRTSNVATTGCRLNFEYLEIEHCGNY